jgi:hypothetical protein
MKWLIGLGSVLTALILFWPTLYRYENGGLVRINRFTGYAEKAAGEGWVPAKETVAPVHDQLTPEIEKQFNALEVTAQDFESITIKNSTPWSFVVIESAEVGFDPACNAGSDYVTFVTADRSISAGAETKMKLPYNDRFRTAVTKACGGGKHSRTVTLRPNSAAGPDGRQWLEDTSAHGSGSSMPIVSRKITGDVDIPAS